MNNYALHSVLLNFKDQNLESRFLFENDLQMVPFYRIGYITQTMPVISQQTVPPVSL